MLADITEASQTAYESAEEYLRIGRQEAGLIRQTTLELVTQGEASGKGWRTVQNQMAAELNAKGVTAFVDKAGRKWSLESYCSMATRTTGRQAQVAAALTSDDWDLWQISKIGSTCPLCSVYEGRVYSKSGMDPDYPPLAMAFGKIDPAGSNDLSNTWLNIHPNCWHSLVRYTTAGKSDKQIQAEKDFSSFEKRPADVDYRTKKQIEAYRKKEADRARYRADVKQFEKYKAAGVEGMPVRFETFEKHKRAGDDVYKRWMEEYRFNNRNAAEILKERGFGDIISLDQVQVPRSEAILKASHSELKEMFPSIEFQESFTNRKVEDSFELLDIATQREAMQGLNYIKDTFGEQYLPKKIKVANIGSKKCAETNTAKRRIVYSDKLNELDALLTSVHEGVHIVDAANRDIAEDVIKKVLKDMGIRGKLKTEKVFKGTIGASKYFKYKDDYSELLAWSYEKSLRSDKTELAEKVRDEFLRRCAK